LIHDKEVRVLRHLCAGVATLLLCCSGALAQEVVSSAGGDLGKTAFVVKAADGSQWAFLRMTRQQVQDVRDKSAGRSG
jgi:hypothetical protein